MTCPATVLLSRLPEQGTGTQQRQRALSAPISGNNVQKTDNVAFFHH
jgi:hypothetical protein